MRAPLLGMIALLAILLVGCGAYQFRGTLIEPATQAADFTLTNQDGQPWQLSRQQGQIVLLFFGFTNCPDICPTTLADLAAVRRKLGDDASRVQVVLVSVDPERDTIDRLGRYVAQFSTDTTALRGEQEQLDQIYQAYGVYAAKRELPNSALRYTMDHTSSIYVIDLQGRWRALLPYGSPIDDMVGDLRFLLREGG